MSNNGGVYSWSSVAANNATADSTVNWQEGQSPSSINDSARAMMASTAKYRDDISGVIVTTGTSTAYIVTTNQDFDSLADLGGKLIAFTPHVTNVAGPVTLNPDSLALIPLRSAPNTELLAGVLIQGTPYCAVYNATDNAFYLQGYFGQPLAVPVFGGMDYWDTIAPNSNFIFPAGQAISRTVFAKAFSRWSTTFGAGDGSTTFNVPDKTGRVSAMMEATATRLTSTFFGGNSVNLGAVGGLQSHTLTTTEMPSHNHGVSDPGHVHDMLPTVGASPNVANSVLIGGINSSGLLNAGNTATGFTGISIQNQGGGGAHAIVQPTICCNYIIRII